MKTLTHKITFLAEAALDRRLREEAAKLSMTPGELIRTLLAFQLDHKLRKSRQKEAINDLLSMRLSIDPNWERLKKDIIEARTAKSAR